MRRAWLIPVACALLWSGVLCAKAGEFTGPGGIAFRYPEGWVEAPEGRRKEALDLARSGIPQEANRVEVAAMFLDPNDPTGRATLTVLATEGGLAVNDDSIRYAQKSVTRAYERAGCTVQFLSSRPVRAADRKAILIEANVLVPGEATALREWRVLVPAGRRMLCMICLAGASDFARYEAGFSQAIATLQPGREGATPNALWARGLVALGVLVLAWVFLRSARRKTAASRREKDEE